MIEVAIKPASLYETRQGSQQSSSREELGFIAYPKLYRLSHLRIFWLRVVTFTP